MDFYDLLEFIKSAEFHTMSISIVGGVKLLRSALGTVKGKYAIFLTFGASILVSGYLFADEVGLVTALVAGIACGAESTFVFFVAKQAGKKGQLVNVQ